MNSHNIELGSRFNMAEYGGILRYIMVVVCFYRMVKKKCFAKRFLIVNIDFDKSVCVLFY